MTPAARIAYSLLETLVLAGATSDPAAPPDSLPYATWMCHQIIDNPNWDEGKANRWIGYIQGVLICQQASNLTKERDRVRTILSQIPNR